MKQKITYCILSFLLITFASDAQIEYTFVKKDVGCNSSTPGSIILSVTPTNPPYTFSWNTGQTSASIYDLVSGDYTLTITDSSSNDTTVTINIKDIVCEMAPAIVFTPNSDGFNDAWSISNYQYFPDSRLLVYNKLGQKVFEHNGLYEPWDGKDLLNIPVPDASYFYILYQDKKDEKTIKKGCVTIIR